MLFVVRMDELPGHEFLLHVLFSVESPGQTEDFFERDIFRDGTSHARFLICSPPPQVFVHVDHSPQLDHSEKKWRWLVIFSVWNLNPSSYGDSIWNMLSIQVGVLVEIGV